MNRTRSLRLVGRRKSRLARQAFTLLELLVVIGLLAAWAMLLVPALARTQPVNRAVQCQNNLRQLTVAWRQYTDDYNGVLLAAETTTDSRTPWMTGWLDFTSASVNWDPALSLGISPLWKYVGQRAALFRCPADASVVPRSGGLWAPRVRSYSMSTVCGTGAWLDRDYNSSQTAWRTYAKGSDIVLPAKTFVFADEHPDSINDGVLQVACTGAQPEDGPTAARIIDLPASFHNSAGVFSFADGRVLTHRWLGSKMRAPLYYQGTIALNVPAYDSWIDVRWLAENTTVRR